MISVIIVNYNRKDLLRKCLDSVRGQTFKDIEIIVVDNASSDGTVEMLGTFYPEVRLLCNTRNVLLCKAYNQAIDASKGSFILCLNNDVILDKDYLKEAIGAIGLDIKIGMVSGKILRQAKLSTASAQRSLIDSTGLFIGRNRKPIERGYGKEDRGQYEKPEYIFGVSGACSFFRRSMLMAIKDENGYFDERFGMYYEDLDLCWRAYKKGWKAYYNPKAIAYHIRGATAVVRNGRSTYTGCMPVLLSFLRKQKSKYKMDSRLRGNDTKNGLTDNFSNFPYISEELKIRYIKNRYKCMRKNDSIRGILLNLPFILWYEIKIWVYLLGVAKFNLTRILTSCIIYTWRS